MVAPKELAALWHWKSASRVRSRIDDLHRFAAASPAQRRAWYGKALLAILQKLGRRADALPEWRDAASIRDPDDLLRLWPSLPILSKAMLRERFVPEDMAARFSLHGRIDKSGGSTGEPTRFFHDEAVLASSVARMYYFRRRLGWAPGMSCISLWGADRDIGKAVPARRRIGLALRRELSIAGFRIDRSLAQRFVALVNGCAPVAVYGYSSLLAEVARRALDDGLHVLPGRIRVAWNGAEALSVEQFELFQAAFGVPLHNHYGGRELSTIACQFRPGAPLEILGPDLFAEIVDENGHTVQTGQPGRLLLTSTVCAGTPFLRYDIGDIAVADAEHWDEGGLRALRSLCGRQSGILRLPDGTRIYNGFWSHLFKEYPTVHRFQVVVRDAGLLLRLEGTGFSAACERDLQNKLRQLDPAMSVQLEWTHDLPRTSAGKLLQVVDERAPTKP